jgi:hypothetical protein
LSREAELAAPSLQSFHHAQSPQTPHSAVDIRLAALGVRPPALLNCTRSLARVHCLKQRPLSGRHFQTYIRASDGVTVDTRQGLPIFRPFFKSFLRPHTLRAPVPFLFKLFQEYLRSM